MVSRQQLCHWSHEVLKTTMITPHWGRPLWQGLDTCEVILKQPGKLVVYHFSEEKPRSKDKVTNNFGLVQEQQFELSSVWLGLIILQIRWTNVCRNEGLLSPCISPHLPLSALPPLHLLTSGRDCKTKKVLHYTARGREGVRELQTLRTDWMLSTMLIFFFFLFCA